MDPYQEYERLLSDNLRRLQEDSAKDTREQIKLIKRKYRKEIRSLKLQVKEYCNVSQGIMAEFKRMQTESTRLKLDNTNLKRKIRLLEIRRVQENDMYKQCMQETLNDEIAGQLEAQRIRIVQDRIINNVPVSPEHDNEERNLESGGSSTSSNNTESSE